MNNPFAPLHELSHNIFMSNSLIPSNIVHVLTFNPGWHRGGNYEQSTSAEMAQRSETAV